MKKRKLTPDQERGMLKQAPGGALTSFLYDNHDLFEMMKEVTEQAGKLTTKEEVIERFGRYGLEQLEMVTTASVNNAVRQSMMRMVQLHSEGVKVIAPTAKFSDSMALTEANYNCEDFRMPYPTVVIEIPKENRGTVKMDRNSFTPAMIEIYNEYWGIDMEKIFTVGAEFSHIIISETPFPEEKTFEQYEGGKADKHIAVEIITSEFLRGPVFKRTSRAMQNLVTHNPTNIAMNPAPLTFFGRPMIKGQSVEKVFMQRMHIHDNSPGSWEPPQSEVVDGVWMQGSESDYTMKVTRMAMNIIFALVNMGYDEERKMAAPKLVLRGGEAAQRAIPDVLKPSTVIDLELGKFKYEESFGDGTGKVRPHFRRGHWRRQRHGEGRLQIKNIWIMPIVVNKKLLREGAEKNVIRNATE